MGEAFSARKRKATAWRFVAVVAAVLALALTVTGTNLAGGVPLGPHAAWHLVPTVAFDGTNYLVVWQDGRGDYFDVYGARVSPASTVLDPGGIAISTATREQLEPTIAFDGTNYLVVWSDYRSTSESDIYGTRVSRTGAVLDPGGIAIATASGYQSSPAIAFDGTNYLVAWVGANGISGTRISPAGTVLDPGGIAIASGYQDAPAIAFDGTNYLAAWGQNGYDIYGTRISQAGAVLDPGGIAIASGAGFRAEPTLAFNGTNYLVAWRGYQGTYYDVFGARVSPAGTVLDPGGIAISTATYHQQAPSVASDGTNYLVTWQDSRSGSRWDIYGARVDPAGTVLDPGGIAISTTARGEEPALAFDGTNYLVVWRDSRSDSLGDIYGARVTRGGAVLDTNGFQISTALPPPGPPPPPPPPPAPPQPPPPPAACVVPRVVGLRLAPARTRILRARCRVGRIRRVRRVRHGRAYRVGRVLSQSLRAGRRRPFGTRINLVLGRR
jgi:hypothetical protein